MYTTVSRSDVDQSTGANLTFTPPVESPFQDPQTFFVPSPSITRFREKLYSDSEGSHSSWKDCEHYKCSSISNSGTASVRTSVQFGAYFYVGDVPNPWFRYDGSFGSAGETNAGLPSFDVPRPEGGFVPAPDDLNQLLQHGLSSMMPVIKDELSLINSIIELKDMATLRGTLESIKTIFHSQFTLRAKVPLAELFRAKSDVYLQYKFNIATLLSDISGIYRSLAKTERRINDFISRSGRVRVSHFTKTLTESPDNDSDIVDSDPVDFRWIPPSGVPTGFFENIAPIRESRFVRTDPATFHMQVQYNYNYTEYQREHARILAFLDSFGVNLNPAIIWNAIPWSFVVDWVFGVSRYLSTFKVAAMEPKINILRCLWSIRRSRQIQILGTSTYYVGSGSSVVPLTSLARPTTVETAYRRQNFSMTGSLIQSSGLSPTEISLGAALVLSRRRRPKRLRLKS
jgi:hypothetical protein